jgi:hypothetical protein
MKVLLILFIIISCHFLVKAGDIIQITAVTRNLVPKGKSTDAIDGDWIMKNDKVIAVIGNAVYGREANFRAQSIQGAVIDFTSLIDNNDYLDAFYPQGFPGEDSRRNPALFADKIEVIKSIGSEIILRAVRTPTDKVPYESITEYTLKDGENFLRIKTMYFNPSKQNASLIFADKLRLDYDTDDSSPLGKHKLVFMYNKWFNAAYGIYSKKGLLSFEKPIIGGVSYVGLLAVFQDVKTEKNAAITLEPGQRIEFSRYLLYGKDVAEIQRDVMGFDETDAEITTLKIADTNKKPIPGVFLDIFDNRDSLISFAITNPAGVAEIPLIEGDYKLHATKVGHDTLKIDFSSTKKPVVITATMKPLTSIMFTIKEAGTTRMIPVKLEFKGINGSPDPFLGPPMRAEGANNLYYSIKNSFQVPVPPGQYLVTISHGLEYEAFSRQVDIKRGETKAISAEIRRSFSSPDWVIADLHSHSVVSGDASAETRSRVINFAGIGVEFAPATDHNRIGNYTDAIKSLGLEEYIASANGLELTGPTGVVTGPNHQNAFPLTLQVGKQSGGAPAPSSDVYNQVKALYDYDKGKVKFLQHNHPGGGISNLYFDKNRDGILDKGYETRGFTDAIELQHFWFEILNVTSDNAKNKKNPVFYWLQMINQGDRMFATATSDNHSIGERRGLLLTYIYTKKDDPLRIDPSDIALNAKKGHMVMTNGPFLNTDINGFLPGDEIKSTAKGLKMNIEVYANNEIEIDRVQVLVNGRQDKNLNFTIESNPGLFTQGSRQFLHTFPLIIEKDANVIVVATGKKRPLDERLSRKETLQFPIAVANPFFIDVKGDGYTANKDTLGESLPVLSTLNR